jgi:hypothetical protein
MTMTTSQPPPALTNGDVAPHQPELGETTAQIPSARQRRGTLVNEAVMAHPDGFTYLPSAPEAPRGPLISYKSTYQSARPNDGIRSFSARTRDLPPAAQFALLESDPNNQSTLQNDSFSQAWRNEPRRSVTQPLPSSAPAGSKALGYSNQAGNLQESSDTMSRRESEGQTYSISRSGTVRSVKGGRRDWAPNRSPLQQLEATLHGISKEEKRARVIEAEMQLREQIARRQSQRGNRDPVPVPSEKRNAGESPTTILLSGQAPAIGTNLNSEKQEVLHRSAPTESKRPESRRNSTNPGRSEPQDYQYVTKQAAATLAELPTEVQYAAVQTAKLPQFASAGDSSSFTKSTQGIKMPRPGYHVRAYSRSNSISHDPPRGAKPPLKPALLEPFASAGAFSAAIEKMDDKKAPRLNYENPPPGAYGSQQNISRKRTISEPAKDPGGAETQRPATSTAEHDRTLSGLGLSYTSGSQQGFPREDDQPDVIVETKRRRHTVSFDVPPPTPPPLSEWKHASIAQLTLADKDFQRFDVEKGKAWWERSGTSNRRQSRALPSDYHAPAPKEKGKFAVSLVMRKQ